MLTVDDYGAIRRVHRDGKSIRQIACEFGFSRITVWTALTHPEPVAAVRKSHAPVFGPFQATIDQTFADEQSAPPKQRHTAAQMIRDSAKSEITEWPRIDSIEELVEATWFKAPPSSV